MACSASPPPSATITYRYGAKCGAGLSCAHLLPVPVLTIDSLLGIYLLLSGGGEMESNCGLAIQI